MDPLGGLLFTLVHFSAFHSLTGLLLSCLFISVVDDTHIGPILVVFYSFFFLVKFGRPCKSASQVCCLDFFKVVFKVFAFV